MVTIKKIIILSVLVAGLNSCNTLILNSQVTPVVTATNSPISIAISSNTPTITPILSTETAYPAQIPVSIYLENVPDSLIDVKNIALIASENTQSVEFQSLKYVMSSGFGQYNLYDDIYSSKPYKGILEYLNNDQLIFVLGDIPILTILDDKIAIHDLFERQYELWKSGRWYLVTSSPSFQDTNSLELFTNIDNDQGSVITIIELPSSVPLYYAQGSKFYRYSVEINVFRDNGVYGMVLYIDENFELVDVDFENENQLEEEIINIWISRIQDEIMPDFIQTYLWK